jgi:hypothetical protein
MWRFSFQCTVKQHIKPCQKIILTNLAVLKYSRPPGSKSTSYIFHEYIFIKTEQIIRCVPSIILMTD